MMRCGLSHQEHFFLFINSADRDYNGDFSEPYAADFGILR